VELNKFIAQALTAIVEGVIEAQKTTKLHGAYINPGGLMRTTQSISENTVWDNRNNNIARTVNFDIAVTIEDATQTSAKIGVVAGLLNMGAGGDSENKAVAASRIQFSIPLLLPTEEMPPESRRKKQHVEKKN